VGSNPTPRVINGDSISKPPSILDEADGTSTNVSTSTISVKAKKERNIREELNAKIDFITQFASKAYFNKALKKLASDQIENATTICDYIMAKQPEFL
jgi:hypothetical protein